MALRWNCLVALTTLLVGLTDSVGATLPYETHCVVRVVDQTATGELIVGPAECYESFRDAQTAAERAAGERVDDHGPVGQAIGGPEGDVGVLSFTLGIHYDGSNGTGSSITVVGSACSGGWWNTGTSWANRISSSWNGCYRLRHYDGPNKTGAWGDTVGAGSVHNLSPAINNKTESVAYLSS